jgi:hypothetical protein
MIRTLFIFILAILACGAASAQVVEFIRPESDISKLLSIRQEQNLDLALQKYFPLRTLRHVTHSFGKISEERIIYEILKQRGAKYAVVIFTGSWQAEASQLAIFRIEAGGYPSLIYRSHSWHSNYSDSYHEVKNFSLGKENIILLKEGEMGKSPFVVASLFSFREKRGNEDRPGYFFINDLTPQMPRLKAHVGFPLKALYAQAVKLEKDSDHLLLQAGDVEFSWDKSDALQGLLFWKYDKSSRKFTESKLSMAGNR